MRVRVVRVGDGHRVDGAPELAGLVNRFLEHLDVRRFSPATVRAYAFDLSNFSGFLVDRDLRFDGVRPVDLFDYLDWQRSVTAPRLPATSTMNRRVSTVRSWFGFLVGYDEDRKGQEATAWTRS